MSIKIKKMKFTPVTGTSSKSGKVIKSNRQTIKASDDKPIGILGTFEGEALDSNITNLNGLDISSEVMTTVFESDEYKQGIELGWYIGFLGHPEDPNCMDFRNACIVMTDGYIDDNGKVYAKFNLIDTPVGRIVKAFIDAGVTFGISIRGAGDIEDNAVDPETFMFRGFDLVSFPAYPEAIPTFTQIAASTDAKTRAKYKKVCAAVNKNLDGVTSSAALNILQTQFAAKSPEYKAIENRKSRVTSTSYEDISTDKVMAVTELYVNTLNNLNKVQADIEKVKRDSAEEVKAATKKAERIRASYDKKIIKLQASIEKLQADNDELVKANKLLERSLRKVEADRDNDKTYMEELQETIYSLKHKVKDTKDITASTSNELGQLRKENSELKANLDNTNKKNLIYKRQIQSHAKDIEDRENVIAKLKLELSKTVTANSKVNGKASNCDEETKALKASISASNRMIETYQKAYANLYSKAVGSNVDCNSLSITASTSVRHLQQMIGGASVSENLSDAPIEIVPSFIESEDSELITL